MELRETFNNVEAFCQVMSLAELLEAAGVSGTASEDPAIAAFKENTLILIEKEISYPQKEKREINFQEFLQVFKGLLGIKRDTINGFISTNYENFPMTHIQRKDIQSKPV